MTQGDVSVVGRCDARNCRHNQDMKCTAGQIEVSMSGGQANCLTFSPGQSAGTASEQPRRDS